MNDIHLFIIFQVIASFRCWMLTTTTTPNNNNNNIYKWNQNKNENVCCNHVRRRAQVRTLAHARMEIRYSMELFQMICYLHKWWLRWTENIVPKISYAPENRQINKWNYDAIDVINALQQQYYIRFHWYYCNHGDEGLAPSVLTMVSCYPMTPPMHFVCGTTKPI